MKKRPIKQLVFTGLLLLCLTSLAGCSETKQPLANNKLPKEVTIGMIRVPNDKQVAISQDYFKEVFADKGIETKFVFFDSGVAANQAFASGSIDFAEMGYTNGVVALSAEIPVELIWLHDIIGENEALVVRKEAAIKSVADLAGKKIATPFSSTAHFSLLQATKERGVDKEMTLLDMQTSEIVAAWERGDIDGAYTWEPTLSVLSKTGNVLVTSATMADKGYLTANIELVHQDFAKKYPQLVVTYLKALNQGVNYYRKAPKEAAGAVAKELGLTTAEVSKQMDATRWLTSEEQLTKDFLGTAKAPGQFNQVFLETARFLAAQGAINTVPTKEAINTFINPSYIELSLN